ncbi:SAM-dependent methyltransferase [Streptomyces sp. NBC_01635]|uniref:SAM-dependent methyltransferase n=1 Tax=Streptomyces sp. NBC_01635 TaxID=2975904 RepID=UPI00387082EE|nr:SAM-dependent methyltransferase [Streptomyces sp. NBC_01635]WTD79561.1 SAM-dependent methyltransferase [Streptomyces sp. NBC_01635]
MIDVRQASDARIHNFLLGGSDHYEADRAAARRLIDLAPNAGILAHISRQFLVRAVRYLASERRISQFFDHGCGLPTRDNVHEIARRVNKAARVVYVDNDPVVLAHARMMLAGEHTLILDSDMLDSAFVWSRSEGAGFLKSGAPAAVLFVSALHCVSDDQAPLQRLRALVDGLPSGSYLVLSDLASDSAALREEASLLMQELTGHEWARVWSPVEMDRFFEGLEPIGGPVGDVSCWRPGASLKLSPANQMLMAYGGVARKP